jgi:type IV pilus assembly protein PilM
MAGSIWAVDIGDWSLTVVRGTYNKRTDAIAVDLFDEIVYGTLPCGFEAGPLERRREGVLAFRRKYQIAPGDDLCVALSGNEVFSRFINLPPVPESIGDIIRYEARQQIPFDIDEVVWDYQPVKDEHELGEEIEVGLFALKRERVDEMMDLLDTWRKNLRIVQDAPLAVYNFLEYEGYCNEPLVVADIGGATSDLLVLNPPRFWLRTLLVAGGALTRTLMEKFNIGPAEAERMKRRLKGSEHRARVLRMFRPIVEDLNNEIQRSLGYYKSLAREVKFERILLLGSALKLDGLAELIASGLQYEVQTVQRLRRIRLDPSVDADSFREGLPGACAALGLLVQGARQGRMRVNMVPDEVVLASEMSKKRPWAMATVGTIVLLVGVLVAAEALYARPVAEALTSITQSSSRIVEEVNEDRAARENTSTQISNTEEALSNAGRPAVDPRLYLHVLPVISKATPKGAYLRRLTFSWREQTEVDNLVERAKAGRLAAERMETLGYDMGYEMGFEEELTDEEMWEMGMLGQDLAGPMGDLRERRRLEAGPDAPELAVLDADAPLQGEESLLVVEFEGESLNTDHDWVEQNVFEALKNATFTGRERKLFSTVAIGPMEDVEETPGREGRAGRYERAQEEYMWLEDEPPPEEFDWRPGADRRISRSKKLTVFRGVAVVNSERGTAKPAPESEDDAAE